MKKYIALIIGLTLTLMVMALSFYSANEMFEETNKASLAGNYIEKIDDRLALSEATYIMENIKDDQARALEKIKVNELRAAVTSPPQSLDKSKWFKNYIREGLAQFQMALLAICFLLSIGLFVYFRDLEYQEKYSYR